MNPKQWFGARAETVKGVIAPLFVVLVLAMMVLPLPPLSRYERRTPPISAKPSRICGGCACAIITRMTAGTPKRSTKAFALHLNDSRIARALAERIVSPYPAASETARER